MDCVTDLNILKRGFRVVLPRRICKEAVKDRSSAFLLLRKINDVRESSLRRLLWNYFYVCKLSFIKRKGLELNQKPISGSCPGASAGFHAA